MKEVLPLEQRVRENLLIKIVGEKISRGQIWGKMVKKLGRRFLVTWKYFSNTGART